MTADAEITALAERDDAKVQGGAVVGWWSLEELIIPDPLLRFVSDENRRPGNLKTLIASCFKAWDTMNPGNAAQFYAKDPKLVFFDLGPLKFDGWSEFSEGAKKTFDSMLSRNLEMRDDFRATRRGNVAWVTVTFRLSGRLKNGKRLGTEGRYTAILEKTGDRWLIVHDHWSAPLS